MDFGSTSSSFDSPLGRNAPRGKAGDAADKEMQEFVLMETQKAQFQAQVHKLNDVCWERCVERPSSKLDSRQETCLSNCVDRFVDVSLTIANRFAQHLQKQGGLQ